MEKIKSEWEVLTSYLPQGWEEKAKATGAIRRSRKVSSAGELLQVELLHLGEGLSLKEASAVAREGEVVNISSVALYKRLRNSGEWLKWIAENMLKRFGVQAEKPIWLENYNVRAVDGSHISEQGSTGTDWILHYSWELFGMRNDYFEITPVKNGETMLRFPVNNGDLILADRLYGKSKSFDYITGNGASFIIRLKHKAVDYFDTNGTKVNLLDKLRELRYGEILDIDLHYKSGKRVDLPLKPIRICAVLKSEEAAERSKRKTLRRIKREKPKKGISDETIEMSKYFIVGTSIPSNELSAVRILEVYRMRWQIEIAFKRLKSIMQLGQLPKHDPESCSSWLYGKMVYALLCYCIMDIGRIFSPWGYPLKTPC